MDDVGYPNLGELHMKKSCQNAKVGFILFPSTRGRDWRIQALAQEDEDDEETEEFQEADEDEDEQVWRPAECHGVMVCQEMGYETNGEDYDFPKHWILGYILSFWWAANDQSISWFTLR